MSEDNQKLNLKNLHKADLPAPKDLPPLSNQSGEDVPDLFLWCVDDITIKLQKLGNDLPDNFRELLYQNIFVSTLDLSMGEFQLSFPKVAKELSKIKELKEVLEYLSKKLENDIEIGLIVNKALIASYANKCMEFEISIDPFLSSFLYNTK